MFQAYSRRLRAVQQRGQPETIPTLLASRPTSSHPIRSWQIFSSIGIRPRLYCIAHVVLVIQQPRCCLVARFGAWLLSGGNGLTWRLPTATLIHDPPGPRLVAESSRCRVCRCSPARALSNRLTRSMSREHPRPYTRRYFDHTITYNLPETNDKPQAHTHISSIMV